MARQESVIFGVRACLAVAESRPHAIRRVLYDESSVNLIGPLLKATAAQRRVYRQVTDEDLRRVARSIHHEGVVVVTDHLPLPSAKDVFEDLVKAKIIIALDGVENPHNQGAILRSAAWFGVDAILLSQSNPNLNPAAIRVAQGGAELVRCIATPDLAEALKQLAGAGFEIVGADQGSSTSVFGKSYSSSTVLVMGNERDGLSKPVRAQCTREVSIPGTGGMESLNVSVAAGILMSAVFTAQPTSQK